MFGTAAAASNLLPSRTSRSKMSISTSKSPIGTMRVSSTDNFPPWEHHQIPEPPSTPQEKQTRRRTFKKRPTRRQRETKANRLLIASMVGMPHNKRLNAEAAAKKLAADYISDKLIQKKNKEAFNNKKRWNANTDHGVTHRYPYISLSDLVKLRNGDISTYMRIEAEADKLEKDRKEREEQSRIFKKQHNAAESAAARDYYN